MAKNTDAGDTPESLSQLSPGQLCQQHLGNWEAALLWRSVDGVGRTVGM